MTMVGFMGMDKITSIDDVIIFLVVRGTSESGRLTISNPRSSAKKMTESFKEQTRNITHYLEPSPIQTPALYLET